jgi:lipopolysaccharide cholinephosphotransferase
MNELNVREIREIQMKIMDYVDEFCSQNGIQYFLVGGTLIGAVRHNGYIPWDDDIDIMMYRDEYEKFITLFNASQDKYYAYSLQDEGYHYPFCKICDKTTILIEDNIKVHDIEMGVFVDLFPLDKLPEDADQDQLLDALHALDKKMYGKSFRLHRLGSKPFKQRLLILLYKVCGIGISKKEIAVRQDKISRRYGVVDTDQYGVITSAVRKRIPTVLRSENSPIEHKFENRKYKIPSQYDRFLSECFGNYMKLPPEESRVSNHSFTVIKKEVK